MYMYMLVHLTINSMHLNYPIVLKMQLTQLAYF